MDSDCRGLCRCLRLTLLLQFDVLRAWNTEPLPSGFLLQSETGVVLLTALVVEEPTRKTFLFPATLSHTSLRQVQRRSSAFRAPLRLWVIRELARALVLQLILLNFLKCALTVAHQFLRWLLSLDGCWRWRLFRLFFTGYNFSLDFEVSWSDLTLGCSRLERRSRRSAPDDLGASSLSQLWGSLFRGLLRSRLFRPLLLNFRNHFFALKFQRHGRLRQLLDSFGVWLADLSFYLLEL